MSFFKKLFGIKDKQNQSTKQTTKGIDLQTILTSEDKPEILYESRVRLAVGGDKEINAENAFNTMGVSDENLKNQILEHYIWQSYGDLDTDFNCTMKLVRLDVQEKYKPEVDGEAVLDAAWSNFVAMDSEEDQETEVTDHPDLEKFKQVPWMTDLRLNNISICLNAGFRPTNSLPTELERQLRPVVEIAQRLNAIKALVLWLMIPEDHLESERILNFVHNNNLKDVMDEEEIEILEGARDDQEARNAIGWKFENAWSLAWYFGYAAPEITGQMMSGEQMQEILQNFTCPLEESIEDWIKDKQTISEEELMEKEDLFYCLHNAVRSAQLGRDTVPNGFDPMGNGGVIHERRHSLTWMVSKGVNWDETDLST
ncbi:MAG: DUF4272 domain-containing protein [Bacteroidota bacterium]